MSCCSFFLLICAPLAVGTIVPVYCYLPALLISNGLFFGDMSLSPTLDIYRTEALFFQASCRAANILCALLLRASHCYQIISGISAFIAACEFVVHGKE
jgi:hypothetical protein